MKKKKYYIPVSPEKAYIYLQQGKSIYLKEDGNNAISEDLTLNQIRKKSDIYFYYGEEEISQLNQKYSKPFFLNFMVLSITFTLCLILGVIIVVNNSQISEIKYIFFTFFCIISYFMANSLTCIVDLVEKYANDRSSISS